MKPQSYNKNKREKWKDNIAKNAENGLLLAGIGQ